jgi:hypothetical protein
MQMGWCLAAGARAGGVRLATCAKADSSMSLSQLRLDVDYTRIAAARALLGVVTQRLAQM